MFRTGFYPFIRVMMVLGFLHGDDRSSHAFSVEDEMVNPKLMHRLALPFHALKVMTLQSLAWREVGYSFIMAGHILQASLV